MEKTTTTNTDSWANLLILRYLLCSALCAFSPDASRPTPHASCLNALSTAIPLCATQFTHYKHDMTDKEHFNSNLKSRQMRALLFTILICIFYDISAQTDFYKYGKGFNSCFNNLKTGHFSGYVDGFLQLERYSGKRVLTSFTKDSAQLNIIRDSLEIYDVSNH